MKARRRGWARGACVLLALAGGAGSAAESGPEHLGQRHVLVVSGLGGERYYAERFQRWAQAMADAAEERLGIPPERITVLTEASAGRLRSTKANVVAALSAVAERSRPGDLVLVMLIGHGTAQGGRALFNLPGPDLAPPELAAALVPLAGRQVAVVDTTPASAPFVPVLSAPDRIVIAATASEDENQHTVFAGHFADAFATAAGDRDKDGRTSLLEAFLYARHATRRSFESAGRLVTEHPVLEDDGDGVGSRDPGEGAADGARAARFILREPRGREGDVERLALDAAARRLVEAVAAHARLKPTMSPDAYEAELEALLVELALNRRAAERGGRRERGR